MASVIGVLGGTFDPIHFGHLRLGVEAMTSLDLAEVRFVPAGVPPHRGSTVADAQARLAMARLAVANEPRFSVDDAEVSSAEISYTVDTLKRLRAGAGPGQALCLLLGVDAFLTLTTWSRWQQLFTLAHIGVATRAGQSFDPQQLPAPLQQEYRARYRATPAAMNESPAGCVLHFAMTALEISASVIRGQLVRGSSPRYLLPDGVLDYIARNRLYTKESDES